MAENNTFTSSEKPIKHWGVASRQSTGATYNNQFPSDRELDANQLQKGGDPITYTYTGKTPSQLVSFYRSTGIGLGLPVYTISSTEGVGGIWTTTVQQEKQVVKIEGRTHEEDVDYGSDGQGNIDYDDWTMQRQAKVSDDRWFLQWQDVKNWPPFAKHGTQWIAPWTLRGYKMLVEGGHLEGDIVVMAVKGVDKKMPIFNFITSDYPEGMPEEEREAWFVTINPVSVNSPAYFLLLKEKILILIHTWSKQWVISKRRFEKHFEDMTDEEKEHYDKKDVLVSTQCRGNEDGELSNEVDERGERIRESETYTVTRTWTYATPWDESSKSSVPRGLKLHEPPKNPQP